MVGWWWWRNGREARGTERKCGQGRIEGGEWDRERRVRVGVRG